MLKTAISSNACGTSTLKSPPPQAFSVSDVHPRLRKRLSRCTLDCGFKTPESPALRGFVAERCPITGTSLYLVLKSNGLHRPKIRLKKFSFSLKIVPANIVKKLPLQCCSKPLLIPFFNFSHKWPTFAFADESGYTLAFANRIAHSGSQGETRGDSDGGGITSRSVPHVHKHPRAGCQNGKLCRFWVLAGCTPKERREPRDSDALMRVAVPRRRGPAGLRDLFSFLSKFMALRPALRAFYACEVGVVSLPPARAAYCRRSRCPLVKAAYLPFSEVGWVPLPVRYFF